MPYGVWEDPSCQKPVAQQPFTPMENIGDDYLNAGWLAYPTPQSGVFQGCTTQSQSSNHSSPTLYAPQPHAWSMLPLNTAYSTSSSPTDCRTDSVQRQAEAWATMSNASFTPALEKSRFDFDFDTALQPFTASGPYGQHYDSYACVGMLPSSLMSTLYVGDPNVSSQIPPTSMLLVTPCTIRHMEAPHMDRCTHKALSHRLASNCSNQEVIHQSPSLRFLLSARTSQPHPFVARTLARIQIAESPIKIWQHTC